MVRMGSKSGPALGLGSHKGGSCVECNQACCCCCRNWCHICGVRKCRAQRDSKWAEGTLNTEYLREYPTKQGLYERATMKNPYLPSLARFDDTTTHRADFTPKKGAPTLQQRMADAAGPSRPFDGTTTYTAHYPPKRGLYSAPNKAANPDWSAPFLGITTYNSEYIPRQLQRPHTAQPQGLGPSAPFAGTSEYRDEYVKKKAIPNDRRPAATLQPGHHVDNITTYGHDYVPLPFDGRRAKECCDDPRHPAEHVRLTRCRERPWTACTSCAGGSRPATAPK